MDLNLKRNTSMLPYNTFGIDVSAEYFHAFNSASDLSSILVSSEIKSKELLVLGGGSNILLTKNFPGVVLKNEIEGFELIHEDDEHYFVKVGAGMAWHDFVLKCIDNEYAGVENLSLIPGNVGAAPMQNIGAYGVELKDVFVTLEAMEIDSGKIKAFDKSECNFGYRESVFKKELKGQFIILNVTFKLNKNPEFKTSYGAITDELTRLGGELTIAKISQAVINIRQSKLPDPKKIGNAGSFFKNPVIPKKDAEVLNLKFPEMVIYPVGNAEAKVAAGWLIDNLGWKGKMFDNFGVHDKQALVLVNHGGASGRDIYDLSERIIQSVQKAYGITLHREVNIY
ncbi:MAG: UDP-N-acetylmuramate dehydrogenase [Patiriisocius sp.]|jgi:UDP-N-acetylmuramate dehydrogenase